MIQFIYHAPKKSKNSPDATNSAQTDSHAKLGGISSPVKSHRCINRCVSGRPSVKCWSATTIDACSMKSHLFYVSEPWE
jgi:hypothetical protein